MPVQSSCHVSNIRDTVRNRNDCESTGHSRQIHQPPTTNATLSDYPQARHTRRERVSSAMDGKLESIHGAWIPAIHAGMTPLENSGRVI